MNTRRTWVIAAIVAAAAFSYTSCSKDEDAILLSGAESSGQPGMLGEERGALYEVRGATHTVTFEDATSKVMASDQYGNNLYSATAAPGTQVKKGFFSQVGNSSTYVQFPINYIPQEWEPNQPWRYEYWNGGTAISHFTNMSQGDYKNQCSVYGKGGANGSKKFGVCFGYSDFFNDAQTSFSKCTKIYLTDKEGYGVKREGDEAQVSGTAKKGKFNSVWVSNTTYAYLVMQNGNQFSKPLQPNNGWFKVIFFALDENGQRMSGQVEYYLANFDSNKARESGLSNSIRTGWHKVDLSKLPGNASTLVVTFDGSDRGQYGLNTPAYIAIDDLNVTVN